MYSRMTKVSNAGYLEVDKRVKVFIYHKKKTITVRWPMLIRLTRAIIALYVNKYQIIMLYTWNQHNVLCQLKLNKNSFLRSPQKTEEKSLKKFF